MSALRKDFVNMRNPPRFNWTTPNAPSGSPRRWLGWWITLSAPVVAIATHDASAMTLQLAAGLTLLGLPLPGGDRPAT
jgi:hypothetical protein